jgi:predicted phosphodiesterase
MARRTIVISDLHLGRGSVTLPRMLAPILAGADEIVVNGDVAELHLPLHRDAAARGLESLRKRADRSGADLRLIAGNHDPLVSPCRSATLADGAVFLTHGDAVHPSVAPWSPAASALQEAFIRHLEAIPPQERGRLESVLAASREAASTEWAQRHADRGSGKPWRLLGRPLALLRIALFWREYPALVADFGLKHAPHSEFLLVGHSHMPGAWRIGSRLVVNTGAFAFPRRPHAAVVEGRSMSLCPLVLRQGFYELGEPREGWSWELPARHEGDAIAAANAREGNARPSAAPMPLAAPMTASKSMPVATPLRSHR